jgi:hypothetical protein
MAIPIRVGGSIFALWVPIGVTVHRQRELVPDPGRTAGSAWAGVPARTPYSGRHISAGSHADARHDAAIRHPATGLVEHAVGLGRPNSHSAAANAATATNANAATATDAHAATATDAHAATATNAHAATATDAQPDPAGATGVLGRHR